MYITVGIFLAKTIANAVAVHAKSRDAVCSPKKQYYDLVGGNQETIVVDNVDDADDNDVDDNDDSMFKCKICKNIFRYRSWLHKHSVVHSTIVSTVNCVEHIKTHHDTSYKNPRYLKCGNKFANKRELRYQDNRVHSGNKPYKCHCNMAFHAPNRLYRHRREMSHQRSMSRTIMKEKTKEKNEVDSSVSSGYAYRGNHFKKTRRTLYLRGGVEISRCTM
ncbi:longitudinals lacking protein, isoforms H/M/V-like isoform X2 [Aphis craccivora]|uniref:Longitudinals lacking protein, isoforms H/M/V-like isoform X2 n=1 Tax=Aphis craccivora TaxID=307492 RepID=A0A6G0W147_APHCR|nr:longitudinals lacking protein, isoforms H/M/V-like isoform X2 [Aphis craccivora]